MLVQASLCSCTPELMPALPANCTADNGRCIYIGGLVCLLHDTRMHHCRLHMLVEPSCSAVCSCHHFAASLSQGHMVRQRILAGYMLLYDDNICFCHLSITESFSQSFNMCQKRRRALLKKPRLAALTHVQESESMKSRLAALRRRGRH